MPRTRIELLAPAPQSATRAGGEQACPKTRRRYRQEREARDQLAPRTGNVTPAPIRCPIRETP